MHRQLLKLYIQCAQEEVEGMPDLVLVLGTDLGALPLPTTATAHLPRWVLAQGTLQPLLMLASSAARQAIGRGTAQVSSCVTSRWQKLYTGQVCAISAILHCMCQTFMAGSMCRNWHGKPRAEASMHTKCPVQLGWKHIVLGIICHCSTKH